MTDSAPIGIIGAGLTGSMLALTLARRGIRSDVYEKRHDMRVKPSPSKRTIAMSLSHRGFRALDAVGLGDAVRQHTTRTFGRATHRADGTVLYQDYGQTGIDAIHTIRRSTLNKLLMQEAEKTGLVRLFFDHAVTAIRPDDGAIDLLNDGTLVQKTYDLIVGADGVFSTVRRCMAEQGFIQEELSKLPWVYYDLAIPFEDETMRGLTRQHVHVWSVDKSALVALPSTEEGQYLSNLYSARDTEGDPWSEETFRALMRQFPALRAHESSLMSEPAYSDIYTSHCAPWNYGSRVLLIGDACHAIAPFYAMGMNLCFEDCHVFGQLLDGGLNLSEAVCQFERVRKPDTDAMSRLSRANFYALLSSSKERSHEEWQLLRKLWTKNPERFVLSYAAIAFSHRPLREVETVISHQQHLLNEMWRRYERPLDVPLARLMDVSPG